MHCLGNVPIFYFHEIFDIIELHHCSIQSYC